MSDSEDLYPVVEMYLSHLNRTQCLVYRETMLSTRSRRKMAMIAADGLVPDVIRSIAKLKAIVADADVGKSYLWSPCDPPGNHSSKLVRHLSGCDEPVTAWFAKFAYADRMKMCQVRHFVAECVLSR